jgi:hypothetical protein
MKSARRPTKPAPRRWASPEGRQPPGRGQAGLPGSSGTALPEPAHGHARQRPRNASTCAISASSTGARSRRGPITRRSTRTSWTSGPTSVSGTGWLGGDDPGWRPVPRSAATCAAGMPMYTKSKQHRVQPQGRCQSRRAEPAPRRRPLQSYPSTTGGRFRRRHVARHLRQHQRRQARPLRVVRRVGIADQPAMADPARCAL